MNGPKPDPDPVVVGARRWRVFMKSGEQRIVRADDLAPIGSFGLSFSVRGKAVYGLPFGTYVEYEEIDDDSECPHVDRIPAPEGEREKVGKSTEAIRLVSGATATPTVAEKKLLAVLPVDGQWVVRREVREAYRVKYGGFPATTYKAFNEAVTVAKANGLIEVTGDA
ncbi:MAG: hypothetical protein R3C46_01245 [Hyphomonadaceae bacterium]